MGQPLPRDDFKERAPSRPADRGREPAAGRPEWLTRAGDGEKLETDSTLSEYAPIREFTPRADRADADSWEGAVEQVARTADLPDGEPGTRRASFSIDWSSVLGRLSRYRSLIFVLLAAIVVLAVWSNRPTPEKTTSISAIRRHPERFEGQPVKVKGRVGEVWAVGGGYAFHLLQGREDIVVFTRSRVPVRREKVTISGSISNGILDGKTRQALFEATP